MSDRIKKLKIKKQDGTFSDYIPIGADAENIDMPNGYNLNSVIGNIDVDNDGSIEFQLKNDGHFKATDILTYADIQPFIKNGGTLDLCGATFEPDINELPIILENITLRNGKVRFEEARNEAPAEIGTGQRRHQLFLLKSNVVLDNLDFDKINTWHIIGSDYHVKNIKITNCNFTNIIYSTIFFNACNENLWIENCYFDNIIYTDETITNNRYFISSGSMGTQTERPDLTFMIRNATYINNTFKNNILWEAIDFHGGENIFIKNNYIENCRTGVMGNADRRYLQDFPHGNLDISNNYMKIDLTKINNPNCGIVIGTSADNNIIDLVSNANIYNNIIINYKSSSRYQSAIMIVNMNNVKVYNNKILNSFAGIKFQGWSYNIDIFNNYVESSVDNGCIGMEGNGVYNVHIYNNICNAMGTGVYAIRYNGIGYGQIENNICYNFTKAATTDLAYCNEIADETTLRSNCFILPKTRYKVRNKNIYYYSTSNYLGSSFDNFYHSFTFNGSQGNKYIDLILNDATVIRDFPKGLTVVINDTDEYIVDYILNNKLYFTTPLINSYTNETNIKPKRAVLVLEANS